MRYALLALVAVSLAGCGKGELKEYSPPDKSFTVLLYPEPKVETRQASGVTHSLHGSQHPDGAMQVAYREMAVPAGEVEARTDQARDAILKNTGAGNWTEEKEMVADKHPARLLSADLPDNKGKLKVKIFFLNGRRYQLSVIGTPAYVESADAARFLASFRPTP